MIPIVMAYRPLLGNGPWHEVLLAVVSCAAGLVAFAAALDRWFLRAATWPETFGFLLAALCLFWPDVALPGGTLLAAWITDMAGALLLGVLIARQRADTTS